MNAKEKAKRLRKQCRVTGRVDVEEVAQLLGFQVDRRSFRNRKLDEITLFGHIAVAADLDDPSQRWAIAHAIGHHQLHGGNGVWLRTNALLGAKDERQAEEFAYHLLVDWDSSQMLDLDTVDKVAEFFGVPEGRVWAQLRLL